MEAKINWKNYLKKAKKNRVNPLLIESRRHLTNKNSALDIGCGAGGNARFLAGDFLKVAAIDDNKECAKGFKNYRNIKFVKSNLEDYDFGKNKHDLINAINILPFLSRKHFRLVLNRIIKSLNGGGLLVGNAFGGDDSWSTNQEMTFVVKSDLIKFFAKNKLKIIKFEEIKKITKPIVGRIRLLHNYNFIVQKR